MADLAPPNDLVALKAAWYAASARTEQLAAIEPAGDQTVPRIPLPGRPDTPIRLLYEEQSIALNTARAEQLELTLRLFRHPWKTGQSDVHAAEKALNQAAFALWTRKTQQAADPA
jgi:hypothetical protein